MLRNPPEGSEHPRWPQRRSVSALWLGPGPEAGLTFGADATRVFERVGAEDITWQISHGPWKDDRRVDARKDALHCDGRKPESEP